MMLMLMINAGTKNKPGKKDHKCLFFRMEFGLTASAVKGAAGAEGILL